MRFLSAFVVAALIASSGCSKPGAELVGKWKMDPNSAKTGDPAYDANVSKAAFLMALEFKSDNSFSGMMMEGTYSMKDRTFTLTPTKIMGKEAKGALAQLFQGTLAADGKSFTLNLGGRNPKYTKE